MDGPTESPVYGSKDETEGRSGLLKENGKTLCR
jgi:hypothetical protein